MSKVGKRGTGESGGSYSFGKSFGKVWERLKEEKKNLVCDVCTSIVQVSTSRKFSNDKIALKVMRCQLTLSYQIHFSNHHLWRHFEIAT